MALGSRLDSILPSIVSVRPHETSALLHSASCFFFILSSYFVVLPLRDEGAISLGLNNLPGLFVGSLLLTLAAAPLTTVIFSLPNVSKAKGLLLIHRFFSFSFAIFFVLWYGSSRGSTPSSLSKVSVSHVLVAHDKIVGINGVAPAQSAGLGEHGWFFVSVRVSLFLWVALFNLITISSTWARVIDVMDNEAGSRLFGFVGAGATLGQLFGSLFAAGFAWLGPFLLPISALLMEFAAQSSKGIISSIHHDSEELSLPSLRIKGFYGFVVGVYCLFIGVPTQKSYQQVIIDGQTRSATAGSCPESSSAKSRLCMVLEGLVLILSSSYLICVSLFLWLSAVVSSFFYFQKVNVIAMTVVSPLERRKLFAEINSLIAVFILIGQLTLTGQILTAVGITIALCSAPVVAFCNMIALSIWPNWMMVAVSEIFRKVVTYVVARPGRELLFTVVSQDEKYKAKRGFISPRPRVSTRTGEIADYDQVCIDVIVQRLGDATAAGIYKLLFTNLDEKAFTACFYALPVCLVWLAISIHLGRRQQHLVKFQSIPTSTSS